MILTILDAIVGILLIVTIIMQSQGSGLSTAFGGSGEFYRSKRSIEKLLVWATGGLAFFFAILALAQLLHH